MVWSWMRRDPRFGGPPVSHSSDSLGKVRPLKKPWPDRGSSTHRGKMLGQSYSRFFRFGEFCDHLGAPTFPEAFASMTHPSGNEGSNAFSEPARVRPVPSLPEVTSCT